jgi:hypothetical protein
VGKVVDDNRKTKKEAAMAAKKGTAGTPPPSPLAQAVTRNFGKNTAVSGAAKKKSTSMGGKPK